MTYLDAVGIEQDFVVNLQFAEMSGKTPEQAYCDTAKKYTFEQLAEALVLLLGGLEDKITTTNALFNLALKSKSFQERNARMERLNYDRTTKNED